MLGYRSVEYDLFAISVNRMRTMRYSWNAILVEIAKCDIRCANCHRRRTASQYGWDKSYWNVVSEINLQS